VPFLTFWCRSWHLLHCAAPRDRELQSNATKSGWKWVGCQEKVGRFLKESANLTSQFLNPIPSPAALPKFGRLTYRGHSPNFLGVVRRLFRGGPRRNAKALKCIVAAGEGIGEPRKVLQIIEANWKLWERVSLSGQRRGMVQCVLPAKEGWHRFDGKTWLKERRRFPEGTYSQEDALEHLCIVVRAVCAMQLAADHSHVSKIRFPLPIIRALGPEICRPRLTKAGFVVFTFQEASAPNMLESEGWPYSQLYCSEALELENQSVRVKRLLLSKEHLRNTARIALFLRVCIPGPSIPITCPWRTRRGHSADPLTTCARIRYQVAG